MPKKIALPLKYTSILCVCAICTSLVYVHEVSNIQNYSTLKMLKFCAKWTTILQFEDVKRIRKKVKQHKHKARWAGVSKSPSGG